MYNQENLLRRLHIGGQKVLVARAAEEQGEQLFPHLKLGEQTYLLAPPKILRGPSTGVLRQATNFPGNDLAPGRQFDNVECSHGR